MHDATAHFRLAIAPGIPSSHLSALLALQRAEEPEVTIAFSEVTGNDLVAGLHEGRYDAGLSLQGISGTSLNSHALWTENMAVAMPLQSNLLDQTTLTITELQGYLVFRWEAESCLLLDQRLSALMSTDEQNIRSVTSFEMMALWVAAGYGIGVSAQSRIECARAWGVTMRPLSDGPYQIVTHLLQPDGRANPVSERFERRALKVARDGSA